jgi:Putative 8-oxoguanine DNA glycosylase OGG-like protein
MIPMEDYERIRIIDTDCHSTCCLFQYWEDTFFGDDYLLPKIVDIKAKLTDTFTRSDLVNFYRNADIELETKFIATMIWGNEAPAGGRRDARGPWKLSKIFSDPAESQVAIRNTLIGNNTEIADSYKILDKTLNYCGPNFFTKHFYFFGKSQGLNHYPVIFDDRVAAGIAKLSLADQACLNMVNISANRKPEAYLNYLNFVFDQADKINCEPDKVEYYLFSL